MHTAIAFEAFGARIAIRATKTLASQLRPRLRLPPRSRLITTTDYDSVYLVKSIRSGPDAKTARFQLAVDGVNVGPPRSLSELCREFESDVHFRVAVSARDFLFVHAGVVELGGRAIVLPGRTETGKSTLTRALVQAGGRYFSDEYAVLDSEGRVHAYPKPLSERRPDGPPILYAPETLGGREDAPAAPLGLTVITRFRRGAAWNPQRVSRAQAVLALFDNTVLARSRSEFALAVLAKAVESTAALEGERGEAAEMAAELLGALPADQ